MVFEGHLKLLRYFDLPFHALVKTGWWGVYARNINPRRCKIGKITMKGKP